MKLDINGSYLIIDWGQYDKEKEGDFDNVNWSLMIETNEKDIEDNIGEYLSGALRKTNPKYYYVRENDNKYYIVVSDKYFGVFGLSKDGSYNPFSKNYSCVMMCRYEGYKYIKLLNKNRFLL